MKLKFKIQAYQTAAVSAIVGSFKGHLNMTSERRSGWAW
jgi:hypothetical protein